MDHNVYYVASNCNVPILKLGFTPATSFRYRYGGINLNQLQRLAVKYVISDKEMTHPNLKLANQFRNIFIYDVVRFQGPATVIQGQATVVLKEWNQKYIRYEISNSTNLKIHMIFFVIIKIIVLQLLEPHLIILRLRTLGCSPGQLTDSQVIPLLVFNILAVQWLPIGLDPLRLLVLSPEQPLA